MFFKIGILKNFTNFTGKHLCWSLFFIKLACNFIKKRLQHRRFPVKSANFFRTATPPLAASDNALCEEITATCCHSLCCFLPTSEQTPGFSIFKHVHESRHEQANRSIRYKWRKDRSLIIQKLVLKLKDRSHIIRKLVLYRKIKIKGQSLI